MHRQTTTETLRIIIEPEPCPNLRREMPEYTERLFAEAIFHGIQDYFKQPGVQEEFEAWKAAQRRKER